MFILEMVLAIVHEKCEHFLKITRDDQSQRHLNYWLRNAVLMEIKVF